VVLEEYGLSPRTFAYPHGEHDKRARNCVAEAGFDAAFTVEPGLARPGADEPYALPRIEILRKDGSGIRLLAKVILAGRAPAFLSNAGSPGARTAGSRVWRHLSSRLSTSIRRLKRSTTTGRTSDADDVTQASEIAHDGRLQSSGLRRPGGSAY